MRKSRRPEKGLGANRNRDGLIVQPHSTERDGAVLEISPIYAGLMSVPACSDGPFIAD